MQSTKTLLVLTSIIALLSLALSACNPFKSSNTITKLPGVQAIIGAVPPVYDSAILGVRVPQGVAVSRDGRWLYVAEGDDERVIKAFDMRTRELKYSLFAPGTNAGMRKPLSLAVSRDGILFAVDRLRLVVDMYDQNGAWLGALLDPPLTSGMWEPLGVGLNGKGNLYVTNSNADGPFLAEYDGTGNFITTVGRPEGGTRSLAFPAGVASYKVSEDYIFVADSNNARIAVVDSNGKYDYSYGNEAGDAAVGLPRGIFIDSRGRCFVTDATGHIVKVWDASKKPVKYLYSFGEAGYADGQMLYPNAVAADENGMVYVADTGNDRVDIWRY